jgi:hypothetical protein
MKFFSKRKLIILLLLFNLYFFSFFICYRCGGGGTRFVDAYEPLQSEGPKGVSVFIPSWDPSWDSSWDNDSYERAGVFTRIISYAYKPMTWLWEKKGVGVFYMDVPSFHEQMYREMENE